MKPQVGVLAVVLLTAAPGFSRATGQPSPAVAVQPSFADSLDVSVVNVDVVVTDRKGNRVQGLKRGDFQLFQDGREVEIVNFDEIGAPPPAAAAARPDGAAPAGGAAGPATQAASPLRLVIYFDHQNIHTANRTRAVEQVRSFVRDHLAPNDEVMVATHDLRLRVGQPFTAQRDTLDAILSQLETAPAYGDAADRDRVTALNAILSQQDLAKEHKKLGTLEPPCTPQVAHPAEGYAEATRDRVERTARALTVLVDSLAGIPGRKALLYVSDGVPLTPGEELFQVLYELCGGDPTNGLDASVSAEMLGPDAYQGQRALLDAQRYSTAQIWSRVTRHANASRVTFYSLQGRDPSQTLAAGAAGQRAERYLRLQTVTAGLTANFQNTLSTMAAETGGRLILNGTDLAPDLSQLRDDFRHYYSLGYAPRSKAGRSEPRLEVRVKGSGLRLAYQRGAADRTPLERVADRTLSALLWEPQENPLEVTSQIGDLIPGRDGSFSVPLRLRIPLFKIVFANEKDRYAANLRLLVASRDTSGAVEPLRQIAVPITVPNREVMRAFGQYYLYNLTLRFPPGGRRIAIAVRDEASGTVSYLTQTIQVGAPALAASGGLAAPHP